MSGKALWLSLVLLIVTLHGLHTADAARLSTLTGHQQKLRKERQEQERQQVLQPEPEEQEQQLQQQPQQEVQQEQREQQEQQEPQELQPLQPQQEVQHNQQEQEQQPEKLTQQQDDAQPQQEQAVGAPTEAVVPSDSPSSIQAAHIKVRELLGTIQIPWPKDATVMRNALQKVGLGSLCEDFMGTANRAVQISAPKAGPVLMKHIVQIKISDLKAIMLGGHCAGTEYLRKEAYDDVVAEIGPVVQMELNRFRVVSVWDKAVSAYNLLPFVPAVKFNLTQYTINETVNEIFNLLASREASLRDDPNTTILTVIDGLSNLLTPHEELVSKNQSVQQELAPPAAEDSQLTPQPATSNEL